MPRQEMERPRKSVFSGELRLLSLRLLGAEQGQIHRNQRRCHVGIRTLSSAVATLCGNDQLAWEFSHIKQVTVHTNVLEARVLLNGKLGDQSLWFPSTHNLQRYSQKCRARCRW